MANFLDATGLARLWTDIKAYLAANYASKNVATSSAHGLMSNVDKQYLDLLTNHDGLAGVLPMSASTGDGDYSFISLADLAAYVLRSTAVTITRNTTNCSAISGALCYYLPELHMVFMTCRFTCNAYSANAAKVLGSISSTYAPGTSVALQAIHGTTANSCAAYMEGTGGSSPGSINFKDTAAVASGDNVYVMGFWFI